MSNQGPPVEEAMPDTTRDVKPSDESPAGTIPDFNQLEARQLSIYSWRVMNLKPGEDRNSVHKVDLRNLACTCKDETFRGTGCKHIQYALYKAPERIDVGTAINLDLLETARDVRDLAGKVERRVTGLEADEAAKGSRDADVTGSVAEPENPTELVQAWLDENVAASDVPGLKVGDHAGKMGVKVEPNNRDMSDGQYKGFKAAVGELSGVNWHIGFGDDPCDTCGEKDGEFYVFLPYDVEEVFE